MCLDQKDQKFMHPLLLDGESYIALSREGRPPDECPACHADLHGEEIEPRSQPLFGGAKYFSLAIGIYSREEDRTTQWRCPYCEHVWNR